MSQQCLDSREDGRFRIVCERGREQGAGEGGRVYITDKDKTGFHGDSLGREYSCETFFRRASTLLMTDVWCGLRAANVLFVLRSCMRGMKPLRPSCV